VITHRASFKKMMRRELALELEILGGWHTDDRPGGAGEKAVNGIRARMILDTLGERR
jgi:hypothetical protein